MKKNTLLYSFTSLTLVALVISGCSTPGKKPDPLADAAQTAYYSCHGCHGTDNTRVEFMAPKIIGQKKDYLAAKLRDFRDMKRINPYMNGVVAGMTDQEIADLATYYSKISAR